MKINVKYYAILREQSGKGFEDLDLDVKTPFEVYQKLKEIYNFTLNGDSVKVAINNEYKEMNSLLSDGDSVVFIPPVAGG